MLTSKEFIAAKQEDITKEFEAIIKFIEERIAETGSYSFDWTLDYAPTGAAEFIAIKVKEELAEYGWNVNSQTSIQNRSIKFQVSPNLSDILY